MAILNNMGVTTELPRRDGEKGAKIPGEHEPGCGGGVNVVWIYPRSETLYTYCCTLTTIYV